MTAWKAYVKAKAAGCGTREAARAAGFSLGRPSPQAREMWARAELVLEHGKQHFMGKADALEERARAAAKFEAVLELV